MANEVNTTGAASSQLRSYFNRRLLEYAVPNFKYAEDALKAPLPKNTGSNSTVTWFRWGTPNTTSIATLTEGTTTATRRPLSLSAITATLAQYGEIVEVSDLMSAQELFNSVDQGVVTIGEDAALHLDTLTRKALISGGPLSGNTVYGGNATAIGQLAGATTAVNPYMSTINLLDAATLLKIDNAPRIGGYYHAIITPNQSRDLQAATGSGDWLDITKYVNNRPLLDGEVGMAYGVRVKESTIPAYKSLTSAPYTSSTAAHAAGTVYTAVVYGRHMYGIADLTSQSPYAPSVEIVTGADKADPLNQKTLIGWKAHYASTVLNASFGAIILTNSSQAGE